MKAEIIFSLVLSAIVSVPCGAQTLAVHYDMSLSGGKITESVTGKTYQVVSQLTPTTADGLGGEALRFDGYSTYVETRLPGGLSTETLTIQAVVAAETYPMMQVDVAETTPTYTAICGNVDETAKQGIALELSSQGDLRLRYGSASGFLMTVNGSEKLPRGRWCLLSGVLDKAQNVARLFLDGREIGSGRMNRAAIAHSDKPFVIGKSAADLKWGPFLINSFCGLIDDISISNAVTDFSLVDLVDYSQLPPPDFSYPAERYAASLWRPQFHAMPSGAWTNETHGMLYGPDGRYHLFFQKNANGPYMSRLHWGHVSSADLCTWREEPIAVYPGESYDIKGCWSGCTYMTTDGTPYLLYTGVDNAKARIVSAHATSADLSSWQKDGVVIDGRPAGLSDDFRDPYYFEANGQQYIIVGTSKGGVGACTLHQQKNGVWTNDGTMFYQGTVASMHGTFWEMPNVTPLGDGRWLFTCTPLGLPTGVRTLCWVGTIGADGKFTPDVAVQYLEMGGIGRDGYGLLSPTILRHDGRTLLIGIVPDKLPTQMNYEMGWAHNYSLPRELSVDADGQLVQRPYSGLSALRRDEGLTRSLTLSGDEPLGAGRQLELIGEFTVEAGAKMGFRFLREATLTYDADLGTLTLDLRQLSRVANDGGSYNGVYQATLPERVAMGGTLSLHVYLDGSIADIFVNDRWAYSVRLFPTDAAQVEASAFATVPTSVKLQAWQLDASGVTPVTAIRSEEPSASCCYDLQGRQLDARPQSGLYICNGRKYVAR